MSRVAKIRRMADALMATTVQDEKLIILQKYSNDALIKQLVIYAYNPLMQFDMKEWIPAKYGKMHGMGIPKFLHLYEEILNNKYTQTEARFACNLAVTHMNDEEVHTFIDIMKKECRWGLTIATINQVWNDLITDYPVQHPSDHTAENMKNISFPCVSQVLVEGTRLNIIIRSDVVEFRDISGGLMRQFDSFADQFKILTQNGTTVFDGSAVVMQEDKVVGTTLEDINEADVANIKFFLWDSVRYDGFMNCEDTRIGYNWRYNGIEHMMFLAADKNISPCYKLPQTEIVADMDGINKFMESSGTGVVIKDFAGTWRNGVTPKEVIIHKK